MKKHIVIPESFEELTTKQFKYLLRKYFVMMNNDSIETVDIQRTFANYILGNKIYINPYKREQYYAFVNQISEMMNWIFRNEDEKVVLNFNTTKNLIPVVGKLTGPQDYGSDIRFGEFRIICDILNTYNSDNEIDSLNALVGSLYRPKNKNNNSDFAGNFRIKFNQYQIEQYAKNVKRFPEYLKYGVYLWFVRFCHALINEIFIVEGREVCFSPIFGSNEKNDDSKKDDSLGMISILFTLADAGTFGNVEQTNNALLIDVLCKLLSDYKLAKEIQRK